MHTKVVTTITTEIDLDTMEPTYSVDVQAEDELPSQVVVAAAIGSVKSALRSLEKMQDSLRSAAPPEVSDPLEAQKPAEGDGE